MKVSLEFLYHYLCDYCNQWWTCADIKSTVGSTVFCPHCGTKNTVEEINTFEKEQNGK